MRLEEIKEAIRQLSVAELAEFLAWFEKFERTKQTSPETSLRSFGLNKSEFIVPDDFDAPLSEEHRIGCCLMKTVFAAFSLVLFVAVSSSASPKPPHNLPHAGRGVVQTAHQAKKEMKMNIRPATEKDVDRMVELSDVKRTEYAGYSPVFWHKAADANPMQVKFFHTQLSRDNNIVLVAEENGHVEGFIIASIVNAPPVYDPGGSVCMIDDFTVSKPELWPTTGRALLQEATRQAKTRGAVLSVIVCPHLDEVKRSMLKENGSTIASEWYVHPL